MKACPVAHSPNHDAEKKAREMFRKDDAVSKRYTEGHSGTVWRRLSKVCRTMNPICQRIVRDPLTGKMEQCHNPATLAHHIISPRQGGAMFDLKNLLALCEHCHPPDEGTPCWREGVDYVQSKYPHRSFGGA
jgi:hypothetical protein